MIWGQALHVTPISGLPPNIRLASIQKLAKNKHSSLFIRSVRDESKKLYNIDSWSMPNQTEVSTQKETNPPPTIFKFKKQKTNI